MLPIEEPQVKCSYDNDAVRAFIDLLHGNSPGLIHICSAPNNWTGRTFSEPSDAADYAARLDASGAEGIYMRTTTLARVPRNEQGQIVRGGAADSLALPGFAADIDIAGPGHKHDPTKHEGRDLPPDVASAMAIVEASGLPTPTVWVHSGGGLYPWWLLEETLLVDDPDVLKGAEVVANRIQVILKAAAKKLGWHYGAEVGDLARVLRIPGTVNRKAGGAVTAQVLEPASYEFYDVDTLAAMVQVLFNALPVEKPIAPPIQAKPLTVGSDLTPGDDFEARTSWSQILLPQGATYMGPRGQTDYWRRPGKDSGGHSGTTGRASDRDRLYVFSGDWAPFEPNKAYNKFAAYALIHHNGDHSAAASDLRRLGYGGSREPSVPTVDLKSLIEPKAEPTVAPEVPEAPAPVAPAPEAKPTVRRDYLRSDTGNAERAADKFGDDFRRCDDENKWLHYVDGVWRVDKNRKVQAAITSVTQDVLDYGRKLALTDEKLGQQWIKFAESSQNAPRIRGVMDMFANQPGMTVGSDAFDTHQYKVVVLNGVIDLITGEFSPHDRKLLARRQFNAAYDPTATCPRFRKFMADIQPEEQMRTYVQKAFGYTALGDVDKKAIFLPHGESNTGKSQLLQIMLKLFGDFGSTAAAAALQDTKSTQTNDLHDLKGKRFVTTSETAEGTRLNESLIKRLTGKDDVVSRQLYEANVSWTPECTIWLATNYLPQIVSDDNAMWRRVKPIPFDVVFSPEPGAQNAEVSNIGASIFAEEASGILNWLLEGIALYQDEGLADTDQIRTGVEAYRRDSNNVAEFITDALETDLLRADKTESIPMSQLFVMYEEWCRRNRITAPYGQRRFGHRIRTLGYEVRKISNMRCLGLRPGSSGLLGTI